MLPIKWSTLEENNVYACNSIRKERKEGKEGRREGEKEGRGEKRIEKERGWEDGG